MSFASLAIQFFIDPIKGKPVANGSLYIGKTDLDPEIPANQKSVRLRQENGVEVNTSQPVSLGAGGVPLYNGSPVQVIVDGDYSLKVLDRNGAQVYYVPTGSNLTSLGSLVPQIELQTATEGQTVFNLTTLDYTPGGNDLQVYINGIRQFLSAGAYTETSPTVITFSEGIAEGSKVLFITNEIGASLSELQGSVVPETGKAVLWDGTEAIDARLYGITFDGVTDDTAAWNTLIAAINSGSVKNVFLPSGTSLVSGSFDTITANNWAIRGVMPGATVIKMDAGAGTVGTFFTIGDNLNKVTRWLIEKVEFESGNFASLNGSGNHIVLNNSADGFLDLVKSTLGNGFLTLGNASDLTNCNRTKVTRCQIVQYAPAGGVGLNILASTGHFFAFCNGSASGVAAASFRAMGMIPYANSIFDTGKFVACEFNYPSNDPGVVFEIDATLGTVSSQQFVDCVFDQALSGVNIWAHIDLGAPDDSHISLVFDGCSSNGSTNTEAILIQNAAQNQIHLSWNGGEISSLGSSGRCIAIEGEIKHAVFSMVKLSNRESVSNVNAAVRVADGASGLVIDNCTTPLRVSLATGLPFNPYLHLVEFEGEATNCKIINNMIPEVSRHIIINNFMTDMTSIDIENNTQEFPIVLPFRAVSTVNTPVTVQTIALDDDASYMIKAKVHASRRTLKNRHAYYEITGLFYRSAGGGATLVGALDKTEIETTVGLDATLTASGNNVLLQVTGEAAVGYDWQWYVEIDKNYLRT